MFNWFSLDVIYYPVSAIMWVWYKAFAFVLGPDNFFAWALAVTAPNDINAAHAATTPRDRPMQATFSCPAAARRSLAR